MQSHTFLGKTEYQQSKPLISGIFVQDINFYYVRLTEETDGVPARPWSAAEPRWNADRMFTSKQKNWEGLAAGRKHLHHGQLLPGSTESTDEDNAPRKTCWSEGASPGR